MKAVPGPFSFLISSTIYVTCPHCAGYIYYNRGTYIFLGTEMETKLGAPLVASSMILCVESSFIVNYSCSG
jgi:hypothetical protein